MKKKTFNHWFDAQVIITVLAMTTSLLLWNLFAKFTQASTIARQDLTAVSSSAPLSQNRILLGGTAPRQVPSISNVPANPFAPVTITGSSRP